MDDKEFKKDWIHQCLMEFIGLHLTGMDDYFNNCCDFTPMTENQAYDIMHFGEFIFD